MKKNKRIITLIIIVFIIIFMFLVLDHQKNRAQPQHATSLQPNVLVEIAKPVLKPLTEKASVLGSVYSEQNTFITPKNNGYIKAIHFQEGQFVKAGTPIIELDNTKLTSQATADQTAAHMAHRQYIMAAKLAKHGLVSTQDLEDTQSKDAAAAAALVTDQKNVQDSVLRAPFSGYLGAKTINVGDAVTAGQQLVQIVNRSDLSVKYALPAEDASLLKLGQSLTLISQNAPEHHFRGTLTYIAPAIDPDTRTIALHATVDNPKNQLIPGQFVTVKQILSESQPSLFVPEDALMASLQGDHVMIYRQGKTLLVPVKTGHHQKGMVQILEGLKPNDNIVIAGEHIVKSGQAVKVVAPNTP